MVQREVETPWGPGINFDKPMVRQFYYENAAMWLTEYDFDGLRFDAIHEIKTDGTRPVPRRTGARPPGRSNPMPS